MADPLPDQHDAGREEPAEAFDPGASGAPPLELEDGPPGYPANTNVLEVFREELHLINAYLVRTEEFATWSRELQKTIFTQPPSGDSLQFDYLKRKVIFVGDQSAGKSSIFNRLLGFDVFPVGGSMCTKRPVHLKLRTCGGPEFDDLMAPLLQQHPDTENLHEHFYYISIIDESTNASLEGYLERAADRIYEFVVDARGNRVINTDSATSVAAFLKDRFPEGVSVSGEELVIVVSSPYLPTLECIDIPGLCLSPRHEAVKAQAIAENELAALRHGVAVFVLDTKDPGVSPTVAAVEELRSNYDNHHNNDLIVVNKIDRLLVDEQRFRDLFASDDLVMTTGDQRHEIFKLYHDRIVGLRCSTDNEVRAQEHGAHTALWREDEVIEDLLVNAGIDGPADDVRSRLGLRVLLSVLAREVTERTKDFATGTEALLARDVERYYSRVRAANANCLAEFEEGSDSTDYFCARVLRIIAAAVHAEVETVLASLFGDLASNPRSIETIANHVRGPLTSPDLIQRVCIKVRVDPVCALYPLRKVRSFKAAMGRLVAAFVDQCLASATNEWDTRLRLAPMLAWVSSAWNANDVSVSLSLVSRVRDPRLVEAWLAAACVMEQFPGEDAVNVDHTFVMDSCGVEFVRGFRQELESFGELAEKTLSAAKAMLAFAASQA